MERAIKQLASRPRFAGVPLDPLTTDQILDRFEEFVESSVGHHIATVNLDFIVRAQRDSWLQAILNRTAMNLIDGTPLLWALRALGYAVPERVAGADLVPRLLARVAKSGHRVYLLGGRPEVAYQAARLIVARYPGLRLCGVDAPPKRDVELMDGDTARRVTDAAPAVLLVAFGNPKQEYWLDLHLSELNVRVGIGIGGTVDFLAGHRRRAPKWMRDAGLEWLARLAQEPVRLGPRYARDLVAFAGILARERIAKGVVNG